MHDGQGSPYLTTIVDEIYKLYDNHDQSLLFVSHNLFIQCKNIPHHEGQKDPGDALDAVSY